MNKVHRPKLPKETQKTAAWYVKLWPRYVLRREEILSATHRPDVPASSRAASDPTGRTVVELEKVTTIITVIEKARDTLPEDFRRGVWNNALLGSMFPDYADIKTWKAYKNDFLYEVARRLDLPLQ